MPIDGSDMIGSISELSLAGPFGNFLLSFV